MKPQCQKFKSAVLHFQNLLIALIFICASCSSTEDDNNPNNKPELRIEANLFTKAKTPSRYSGTNFNDLAFSDGDDICVFTDEENPNKWSYTNGLWRASNIVLWPDTTNTHQFHAFYPYNANCKFDSIFSAPLNEQNGSFENLESYDLMLAHKETKFKDSNGIVSFTGAENSFKHALSLIKITFVPTGDFTNATIHSIKLSSTHLFSRLLFSFNNTNPRIDPVNTISELTLAPDYQMNGQLNSYYIIANPKSTSEAIQLFITYSTSTESNVLKSTSLSTSTLNEGFIYQYNIQIREGIVEIEPPLITEWEAGNGIEDIYI